MGGGLTRSVSRRPRVHKVPKARGPVFCGGEGIYGGWFAGGKSYLRLAPALLGLKA